VWQPQGATSGSIYYNGGNVGIGTPSPQFPLDVNGQIRMPVNTNLSFGTPDFGSGQGGWINYDSAGGYLSISAIHQGVSWEPVVLNPIAGNVGIGTTSPGSTLTVNGNVTVGGNNFIYLNGQTSGYGPAITTGYSNTVFIVNGGSAGFQINNQANTAALVTVQNGGNVGIGTTNPCNNQYAPTGCLLSVAGAIQAKEVVVNTNWSDYVFEPTYRLSPLTEVAAYIQENHHLPDVPSEAEVKQKGISLGDMQAKLLAKVEELTLHMIELERKNIELEAQLTQLKGAGQAAQAKQSVQEEQAHNGQ
jgi:hypothetical protein